MDYRVEIKVFKVKDSINLPMANNPQNIANCDIGDLLVCYDGKSVYAKDWNDTEDKSFVLLLNDLSFIEANKHFFDYISGN